MNIQDFHLIYDYYYWANGKILAKTALVSHEQFIAPASFPYGGLRGTLVHILEAERGWRTRFQSLGMATELFPEDFPTITVLVERMREEEKAMRAYLAGLRDEDLTSHLRYTPGDGKPRDRILWHSLLHLANHGTQHRSEAAALLTDYGHSPGDLDFNVFLDETAKS